MATTPKIDDQTGCNDIESPEAEHSKMDVSSKRDTSDINNDCSPTDINNSGAVEKDSHEEAVDSLTSSATAFTISFDDDDKAIKRFGIRDSIRKFAPPKPNTIEKPRPSKSDQCQDQSLTSIESAPGNLSRHSSGHNKSSSGRQQHDAIQQSNVSNSAAFLIHKMLNSNKPTSTTVTKSHPAGATRKILSNEDILASEVDFCETGSDNGTYVVGADPEADAARKKIDELFGVVKAAEASVLANSQNNKSSNATNYSKLGVENRHSLSRERQEHIDRLSRRHHSRSSSSSRQENDADQRRQPRASSRHSNNSSYGEAKPRRSVSQSSRRSYNREASDYSDSQSSHSSLHHDTDHGQLMNNKAGEYSSIKFNRAFEIRRARLGLGEPTAASSRIVPPESAESMVILGNNPVSSSQKRHQLNSNTYKAHKSPTPCSSGNFSRHDGGRYSLRTKNMALPNRLNSAHYHQNQVLNKLPQSNTLIEQCNNNNNKTFNGTKNSKNSRHQPSKSSVLPYQSADEFETSSSISKYRMRYQNFKKEPSEMDALETNSYYNQPTSSQMYDENISMHCGGGSNSANASNRPDRRLLQPGALDSLVISAISSLSVKIHQQVCNVLIEQAKRLPVGNETRLVVEEILPQLQASSSTNAAPSSVEEIDQLLSIDLTRTLKNLKKVEQMVEVISQISNKLPSYETHLEDIS